ncbi:16131_t:CDS:1 [Acaulospora colombiana]|uniref:16131_t:CDS:1 n=1 Tax=Acaulospora colombiana TaxID=27376 RepID=A0ACA9L696_9GLOM|nr:16131_t:CDS:1 [Acaulospora colombiana]
MSKLLASTFFKSRFKRSFAVLSTNFKNHFPKAEVVKVNDLDAQYLSDFFDGKIFVLRVPGFCTGGAVAQALENMRKHEIIDYSNTVGVGKVKNFGMAYYEVNNESSKKFYYDQVLPSITTLRQAFYPFLSPIDKMRLMLDEQWNKGASRLNVGEGKMFIGLARALKENVFPHEDKLERDDRKAFSTVNYVTQAAFNCYLSTPDIGGALQIWNLSLDDEVYKKLSGDHYGIDRSLLPPPAVTIHPEVGELVIFHSRCLHAITESSKTRIAVSGFILYQGKENPLHLWS